MQLRAATGSPEEIIEYIKASDRTGLYFLDIQLQSDMNGLLLAKEIREYAPAVLSCLSQRIRKWLF